ncbi:MAG: hypothetical protein AAGE05_03285 [Pseudomonadota bacterium]
MSLPISSMALAALLMFALAIYAGWMDYKRGRREHLDDVGWVNWTLVMMLALIGAAMLGLLSAGL